MTRERISSPVAGVTLTPDQPWSLSLTTTVGEHTCSGQMRAADPVPVLPNSAADPRAPTLNPRIAVMPRQESDIFAASGRDPVGGTPPGYRSRLTDRKGVVKCLDGSQAFVKGRFTSVHTERSRTNTNHPALIYPFGIQVEMRRHMSAIQSPQDEETFDVQNHDDLSKEERLRLYLAQKAEDGEVYFKSKFIADEVGLSPKEIGALMVKLKDSTTGLEIEKWSYTSATTWRVELA